MADKFGKKMEKLQAGYLGIIANVRNGNVSPSAARKLFGPLDAEFRKARRMLKGSLDQLKRDRAIERIDKRLKAGKISKAHASDIKNLARLRYKRAVNRKVHEIQRG